MSSVSCVVLGSLASKYSFANLICANDCRSAAYCPNGESGNLFYGREAFSGEQWAPIKTDDSAADWVMVGSTDGASMCQTYLDAYGSPTPWASDGSSAGKKQHILCCQKQVLVTDPETGDDLSMEDIMRQQLKPIWYGEDHGWNGGSHNDAQLFCSASGKRELCPYVAVSFPFPAFPTL